MRKILIFVLIALGLTSCYVPYLKIGDEVVARGDLNSVVGRVVGINGRLIALKTCDGKYQTVSSGYVVKIPYEGPLCVPEL